MAFKLPPQWYRETAEELISALEKDIGPLTAETAWRYLYACVAWFEPVGALRYLHLNDRLSTPSGKAQAKRGQAFLERHLAATTYKAPVDDLIDQVARRYLEERKKQKASESFQRNNITGQAMEATLQVLIHKLNAVWPARTPELNTLQGFELAPVGYHSRPDLALFSARDFRLLISTKWTLRKERIGTYLHEAYFYKQRRPDLQVAFVVGEFNLNILEWLMNDSLVDRVYHIHLPMLLDVYQPFLSVVAGGAVPVAALLKPTKEGKDYGRWLGLSNRLFDLSQLFIDIDVLKLKPDKLSVDPQEQVEDEKTDQDEDGSTS